MRRPGRGLRWAGAALLLTAVAVGTAALWPERGESPQPPRERTYRSAQACLLTPSKGLADPLSAQAWAGLEDASARTRVQVRYLAAAGDDTLGSTAPYLASLAVGGCRAVVVTGAAGVQAAEQGAERFPDVQFLLVGGGPGEAPARGNARSLAAADPSDARVRVAAEVEHIVGN